MNFTFREVNNNEFSALFETEELVSWIVQTKREKWLSNTKKKKNFFAVNDEKNVKIFYFQQDLASNDFGCWYVYQSEDFIVLFQDRTHVIKFLLNEPQKYKYELADMSAVVTIPDIDNMDLLFSCNQLTNGNNDLELASQMLKQAIEYGGTFLSGHRIDGQQNKLKITTFKSKHAGSWSSQLTLQYSGKDYYCREYTKEDADILYAFEDAKTSIEPVISYDTFCDRAELGWTVAINKLTNEMVFCLGSLGRGETTERFIYFHNGGVCIFIETFNPYEFSIYHCSKNLRKNFDAIKLSFMNTYLICGSFMDKPNGDSAQYHRLSFYESKNLFEWSI